MKTEELVLIGAAVAGAYFLFKEPKKKTIGDQVGDFINTVFAPGQSNPAMADMAMPAVGYYDSSGKFINGSPARNLISADVIPTTAGVVGMVPTPRGDVSSALMMPDNGAVTYVDYGGSTPIGMPVVGSSFNNNTLASPMVAESIGVPPTALQSPEAWQNGGAQYIGDNPPLLYPVDAVVRFIDGNPVGLLTAARSLERRSPVEPQRPFEYFRTDAGGTRFAVSAIDIPERGIRAGDDVGIIEWGPD